MSHNGTVLALLIAFVLGPALPIREARANGQQMCMGMMQMMMMLQQVKAQASEQKKAETAAYMNSRLDPQIQRTFSSTTDPKLKEKIEQELIENTPLTRKRIDEIKKMSPSQQMRILKTLSSDLKSKMSEGLESSTNNAMMMAMLGMLLCQLMQ